MALLCSTPLQNIFLLPPHPSLSSSSTTALTLSILQTQHFRLNAHIITTHSLNSSSPSSSEEEEQGTMEEEKKRRRRKLRPSFYKQTIDRWSLKSPSGRSRFPWQKQEEAAAAAGINISSSKRTLDDGKDSNLRETHLKLGRNLQNPERNSGLDESSGRRSRLDLIVENLDRTLLSVDGIASASAPPAAAPTGTRSALAAPWVHGGGESQEPHLEKESRSDNFSVARGFGRASSGGSASISSAPMNKSPRMTTMQIKSQDRKSQEAHLDSIVEVNLSDSLEDVSPKSSPRANLPDVNDEERDNKKPSIGEIPERNCMTMDTRMGTLFSGQSGKSSVSLIIDQLKNLTDGDSERSAVGSSWNEREEDGNSSKSGSDVVNLTGTVPFPWERSNGVNGGEQLHRKSNTKVAESTIPELELKRLRNVALRMKERMKVGAAGVTEAVVGDIHKKWKKDEVVKLQFEGPPTLNMKRTHEILERKTGGLVIWRSGSSVVLYRGMTYELPCVQSFSRLATDSDHDGVLSSTNSSERSTDSSEIDSLLDQLGPRYKDWIGCNPLPVDADLLPGVVSGYKPPYRLLPYKTRTGLKDSQMTSLRRLARSMSPHFALGRNRQHQGLARAMVKLWEKSSIAKIAIKRGVPNTCNERMAEEIKKLTGGVLVSRNKEYIVFYRGNDYLTPSIRDVLVEKQNASTAKHDEEEAARLRASTIVVSDARTSRGPLLAGTLAETLEANTRWGNQPSSEDREKMKRDLALAKHASHVRNLERRLDIAKAKVRKAERALAKVQDFLNPAEIPTDLETVTDEERFLFRNMGLKMRGFLLLGRRGVFDGTVENMHLHWKHRELVKIIVKGKTFGQVKHIAISLEAESGGVLISLDKTTKGYAIVIYRGKNYSQPNILRPKNLLTRRQALARSIELQRREALNHHISGLQKRIEMLKSHLDEVESGENLGNEHFNFKGEDTYHSDDDMEDEGEEAYLRTYGSGDEDGDASIETY
ncbi:CRM-domain containing factor CFM3, chloroplastic/mitochondrial [Iris pallida]|uniref:CRM-domain containing factor CFM3, chloroplastic/mitochondrial n=1 Tax=Iris pallida TaxID=29817 RepID=A0AAX6FEB2_IRIPA|nr:CRM-domain containing factor CFM3, chloroplastic/mitochondrial [Iris pallida]